MRRNRMISKKNKVTPCQLCGMTFDGTNKRINEFTICNNCYISLKIPSKKSLLNQKKSYESLDLKLPKEHTEKGKNYLEFVKDMKMSSLREYIKWTLIVNKVKKIL